MTYPFPWYKDDADLQSFEMGDSPSPVDTVNDDESGDEGESLSDDDVNRLLDGDLSPLGLTAAVDAPVHTGAMIALLPSEEDMTRLAIEGGEEDEELHVTLAYLGEAAKITPDDREAIIHMVESAAKRTAIVDADGFGAAMLNKSDGEKDTCVVMLVGGDELLRTKLRFTRPVSDFEWMPEQFSPWLAHMTLAYGSDQSALKKAQTREGPIRFDHVRVVFAGEVTDFPLYDGTATSNTAEVYPVSDAIQADAAVDVDTELGDYDGGWVGPLVVEDSDTGDGRKFSGGSLTWGDTQETIHPFQWAASNLGEHKGSVTAGRIDQMWRHPENPRTIMGKGRFNLNDPDGLRAFRQVRDGFAGGVSIDPDQITDADVELEFALGEDANNPMAKPTKTIFHAGRLRGATLVAFPALVEAAIKLTKKGEGSAVVASVTDDPWKSVENEMRLGGDEIDGLVASAAFAYVQDLDDVVLRAKCRFLHHEIGEDGQPGRASLVACAKHIASINAGRTFGLAHQELFTAYQHMAQHFTDAGHIAPAFALETVGDAIVAAIETTPPTGWFVDPQLSGPTPITVTDDGRVFGHAAAWNSCHTGFADTCVSPPLENDYGYFTTGEVLTAEGHRVAVGQITLGTSHAATRGLSVARAIDHYGDTGTAVADVTAGRDEHGIWIAGAVRPGTSPDHLHALRASALSGDWRRIGGALRMVALLAVNVPGFPIPRVGTALAAGKQLSLVASGVVDRTTMTFEDEIALLAGSCGIAAAMPKKKKYMSLDEELVALSAEIEE
jgi:2'-5' RNA ligase